MCLYNLFYSIQLSLPTMPNNSLALTCCSSQLQNLVSLGCHQTKSQSSIIAQQSDSFGCNKWRYSTQPYGYTTIYVYVNIYYIYVCDDDNTKEKAEVELNISSYLDVSTNCIFFKRAISPLFETAFLQW